MCTVRTVLYSRRSASSANQPREGGEGPPACGGVWEGEGEGARLRAAEKRLWCEETAELSFSSHKSFLLWPCNARTNKAKCTK
jgi:hypothetical protein